MADISSLYPAPPQQQQNALTSSPQQLLAIANQVNALKQFQARQAVGSAFQNALNPDGTINQQTLVQGLQDPAAAYAAPEAIGTMLEQRGRQIANDTAQFQLNTGQDVGVRDALGAMAQDPNLTPTKAIGTIVGLARNRNIPPNIWASVLATMPQNGSAADLQKWAAGIGNIAVGAGPSAARVGAVDPVTGQPITITQGRANITGALPTALPPGQGEALAANQTAFVHDQTQSASLLSNLRPLEQALPLVEKLNHGSFGPGTEGVSRAVAAFQAIGLVPPGSQIANENDLRQEIGQYFKNYAGRDRGAGRSDAGLAQAVATHPNAGDLTQGANLALIKNQIGMDRQDAALPLAVNIEQPGAVKAGKYLDYKTNYYQRTDPRAFSFNTMTPEEKGQFLSGLGVTFDSNGQPQPPKNPSAAYKKFARSYQLAKQAGIISPAQAPQGQ